MIELDEPEMEVLSLLLFPEPFEAIVNECEIAQNEHVVADILKILIHKKLVISGFIRENNIFKSSVFYDSDKMKFSAFKATRRGIELIENQGSSKML
jgi:hypothetical protein